MTWPVVLTLVGVCASAASAQSPTLEQQVKSAFILNFVDYTEWPREASGTPGEIVLCALVSDADFLAAMNLTTTDAVVGSRKMHLRAVSSASGLAGCQVVFVASDGRKRWQELRASTGPGTLTIGESPGFLDQGGVINFVTQGTRVRFEINNAEAKRRGLKLSARVLRLATRVVQDGR